MRLTKGLVFVLFILNAWDSRPAFSQVTAEQEITRKTKTRVDPRYPDLAKSYHLKGAVKIAVTVSRDGSVTKTQLVGGNALLAGASLDAIKQWKYESGPKETVELAVFVFDNTAN
jgi:TonB family protein